MNQPVLLLALVFGAIIAVGCLLVLMHDLAEQALQRRAERRAEWRLAPPAAPLRASPSAPRVYARTLRSAPVRAVSPRSAPLRDVGARSLASSGSAARHVPAVPSRVLGSERPLWLEVALRDAGPPRRGKVLRRR
jgi:hypothetical protein